MSNPKKLMLSRLFGICLFALLNIDCSSTANHPQPPTGPGARFPNISISYDNSFYLNWFQPDTDGEMGLYFSKFDQGSWSEPSQVVKNQLLFVNWADRPSLFPLGKNALVVHWLQKENEDDHGYGIRLAISHDKGNSWIESRRPHPIELGQEHGFLSFFFKGDKVGFVWLDSREKTDYDLATHTVLGNMALFSSYISVNGSVGKEQIIDHRVCDCCPTAAFSLDGNALIAYRDRAEDETRNISVMRLTNEEWSAPEIVHNDGWRIPGCPVNGPVMAGHDNSVAVAWFTAPDGEARVNLTFSNDNGKSFEPPVRIDKGEPIGRPALTWLGNDQVAISWVEYSREGVVILLRKVTKQGDLGKVVSVAFLPGAHGDFFPKMVLNRESLFIVWTDSREEFSIRSKWLSLDELFLQ
ncbi:MAG: hypothetical protein ACE5EE_05105 [Fidelibacterota bacterium]